MIFDKKTRKVLKALGFSKRSIYELEFSTNYLMCDSVGAYLEGFLHKDYVDNHSMLVQELVEDGNTILI